jgi:uncharacterized NAD-dependent epimerase/dehydratase family protein
MQSGMLGGSNFTIGGGTTMGNDSPRALGRGIDGAYFAKRRSGILDVTLGVGIAAAVVSFAAAAVAWLCSVAVRAERHAPVGNTAASNDPPAYLPGV